MDFVISTKTMKELWLKLLTQYYKKNWRAEFIFFQKLVYLRYSDCKNTSNYIDKLYGMFKCLANIRQVCLN